MFYPKIKGKCQILYEWLVGGMSGEGFQDSVFVFYYLTFFLDKKSYKKIKTGRFLPASAISRKI